MSKRTTKHEQVMKHLINFKSITSLQAIQQYHFTRLSASIYTLRKNGWQIETEDVEIQDVNGNKCIYGKYKLISAPEDVAIKLKLDKTIVPPAEPYKTDNEAKKALPSLPKHFISASEHYFSDEEIKNIKYKQSDLFDGLPDV